MESSLKNNFKISPQLYKGTNLNWLVSDCNQRCDWGFS